jgi:hypothetical protein
MVTLCGGGVLAHTRAERDGHMWEVCK